MEIECIEVKELLPFGELEQRLRDVTIGHEGRKVYAGVQLGPRRLSPERLNLSTNYLLRENILFQESLRDHLWKRYSVDTLHLDGLLLLDTPDGEMGLSPPIVEDTQLWLASPQQLDRGATKLTFGLLIDGAHRAYVARRSGELLDAVYVTGVDELYQIPVVPNSWEEVSIVDVLPERRFKKRYLGESIRMYRDFSSLGSSGYRK